MLRSEPQRSTFVQSQIAAFRPGKPPSDYPGGAWGSILAFNALSSVIGGFGGGAGGPVCFDTEVVTSLGTVRGFTQPEISRCWGHQAYDMSYFGPLGFVNLIDSGSEFATLGSGSWSSFLALGGTLGASGVPEPSTWAMMLFGFGAIGFSLRRKRTDTVAQAV